MSDNKREPKPESKPQLPFFAELTDKPMTTRTGIRAGMEQRQKIGGGGG